MLVSELLKKEPLMGIASEINKFADEELRKYVEDIKDQGTLRRGKEIFDPIWGPIELRPAEVVILDSPLLQRLRKIKQLGLANFVYCGADYSRFAHTVGVLKIASDMAGIIHAQLSKYGQDARNAQYDFIQIVRLAAIFHDAGHMFFSHVSERYFVQNKKSSCHDRVKAAIMAFSDGVGNNVPLHEMIGVMLVNSPAVKSLLDAAQIPLLENGLPCSSDELSEVIAYISCLILGRANDRSLLPYHQIINGPIDADKCDYLLRDSRMTNVPVGVDIYRLSHKLSVESMPFSSSPLKGEKGLWIDDKTRDIVYPTIKNSAIEALNQLMVARSAMFSSVYYHQKVQTAESMLRRIIQELDSIRIDEFSDFARIMKVTDDMLGDYCLEILSCHNEDKIEKLVKIAEELRGLNRRCLMKRACSIDVDCIAPASAKGEYEFKTDIIDLSDPSRFGELEEKTKECYEQICSHLGADEDASERTFMIVNIPKVKLVDSEPEIYVSYENNDVKVYSDIFQTPTWIESTESRKVKKYLVTDCKNRGLAYLAFQKALFAKYRVCLRDEAAVCSKVSLAEIRSKRRSLLEKGFYDDSLFLASDILLEPLKNRIGDIAEKYKTFQGRDGVTITEERICKFLRQFLETNMTREECQLLLEGVLSILEQGVYLNRDAIAEGVKEILPKLQKNGEKLMICPLGKETDSGMNNMYIFNDVRCLGIEFETYATLQMALAHCGEGDRIVLIDDGSYSGMQARSILQECAGISPEDRLTRETHIDPLDEGERKRLGEHGVSLAFICLNPKSEPEIRETARQVGINIDDIVYVKSMGSKIFSADESVFRSDEQRMLVQRVLGDIGRELLFSVKMEDGKYKENWSEDRVKKAALGYNDSQQMVVLNFSVPTYTITAFWLDGGTFNEMEWMPLFGRTEKP